MMAKRRTTKPRTVAGRKVTPVSGEPASQRVTAPRCQTCRSDNTYIRSKNGRKRYCKCRACGWTWAYVPPLPAPSQ